MIATLLVVVLVCISSVAALSPIWPEPEVLVLGTTSLTVDDGFEFILKTSSSILERAASRYKELLNVPKDTEQYPLRNCVVTVEDSSEDTLGLSMDESYSLTISKSGECNIDAVSVWGAMYGMETFAQLCVRGSTAESVPVVLSEHIPVSVKDRPRFAHRGLMIDTSRHYLPLSTVRSLIDSLPTSKFNVLHWHIVDAQSFPLVLGSVPELAKGAYSPDLVYSMQNLQDMVQYARDRGVRLVIEVDVPGHAASWTKGYPQIMADCFVKYSYNINDFALNPTLDETYSVVGDVLKDIQDATGSKFLHIGGDEVVYGCWANDTGVTDWMSEHQMETFDDLLGYFVSRADQIIFDLGATPIHWEEVFTAGIRPDPRDLFQVWTEQTKVQAIVQANYSVIVSPSDVWYLNIASNDWMTMYTYEPTVNLTSAEAGYIVGGEVAMWGEHVDEVNIESIVYPRAAAVAERLWSPASVTDTEKAHDRLLVHRCRLTQRGVRASPVEPGYCGVTYV